MAKRIGVLLSGRGSNFEALADSVGGGRLPGAEIAVVVSNREGAPGIEKAKERGIAARVIPSKGLEREVYDRQVVAVLHEFKVDLVNISENPDSGKNVRKLVNIHAGEPDPLLFQVPPDFKVKEMPQQ